MVDKSYQLLVRQGPQVGRIFPLVAGETIVGRSPSSDVVLDDAEVSREHVRLRQTAGGYQIQDMGSTNGTFVAGHRLGGEPVDLEPGQTIRIGSSVELVYQAVSVANSLDALLNRPLPPPAAQTVVEEEASPDAAFAESRETADDLEGEPPRAELERPVEPLRKGGPKQPVAAARPRHKIQDNSRAQLVVESQRRRRTILISVAATLLLFMLCCCLILVSLLMFSSS